MLYLYYKMLHYMLYLYYAIYYKLTLQIILPIYNVMIYACILKWLNKANEY